MPGFVSTNNFTTLGINAVATGGSAIVLTNAANADANLARKFTVQYTHAVGGTGRIGCSFLGTTFSLRVGGLIAHDIPNSVAADIRLVTLTALNGAVVASSPWVPVAQPNLAITPAAIALLAAESDTPNAAAIEFRTNGNVTFNVGNLWLGNGLVDEAGAPVGWTIRPQSVARVQRAADGAAFGEAKLVERELAMSLYNVRVHAAGANSKASLSDLIDTGYIGQPVLASPVSVDPEFTRHSVIYGTVVPGSVDIERAETLFDFKLKVREVPNAT